MLTTQFCHLPRFTLSAATHLLSLHFMALDRDRLAVYLHVTALKEHHDVMISPNIQATELRSWGLHSSGTLLCPIGWWVPKILRQNSGPNTSDTNHSIRQRNSAEEFNIFHIPSGIHPALNGCRRILPWDKGTGWWNLKFTPRCNCTLRLLS